MGNQVGTSVHNDSNVNNSTPSVPIEEIEPDKQGSSSSYYSKQEDSVSSSSFETDFDQEFIEDDDEWPSQSRMVRVSTSNTK